MEIKNKLIGEFMGVYSRKYGFDYDKIGNKGINYHKSWDWLMPVVQKIYSIDDNIDFFKDINLETTYKAVIEFIEEYNKTINI